MIRIRYVLYLEAIYFGSKIQLFPQLLSPIRNTIIKYTQNFIVHLIVGKWLTD